MKIFFTNIFLLITLLKIFPGKLVDSEVFYDAFRREVSGTKKYFYDKNDNIVVIENYNSDNFLESKSKYIYNDNILIGSLDFLNKIKIRYSTYIYDKNGTMIKKNEYDYNDTLLLVKLYKYNEIGDVVSIEDYISGNKFLGKREFDIKGRRLFEERQYNDRNLITITKKYTYYKDEVDSIEYYSSTGRKVGILKRIYLDRNGETSACGLRKNFFDFE